MNVRNQRADRAARTIEFYVGDSEFNVEYVLSELLCDIIVWCQREGADFLEIIRRALQIRDSEYLESWL